MKGERLLFGLPIIEVEEVNRDVDNIVFGDFSSYVVPVKIDETFLSEFAQDMRENGVDDEEFIAAVVDDLRGEDDVSNLH